MLKSLLIYDKIITCANVHLDKPPDFCHIFSKKKGIHHETKEILSHNPRALNRCQHQ